MVRIEKGYDGRRPRTWVRLTRAGRHALQRELEHLKQIIATVEDTVTPED